jgi:hypothetical protein
VFDIFNDAAKRAILLAQDEPIMLGHDSAIARRSRKRLAPAGKR